jgi:hypothetical protein
MYIKNDCHKHRFLKGPLTDIICDTSRKQFKTIFTIVQSVTKCRGDLSQCHDTLPAQQAQEVRMRYCSDNTCMAWAFDWYALRCIGTLLML